MNIAENTITALEMYLNKQFTESDLQELISENMISKELLDQYLQENVLKKFLRHPVVRYGAGLAAMAGAAYGVHHGLGALEHHLDNPNHPTPDHSIENKATETAPEIKSEQQTKVPPRSPHDSMMGFNGGDVNGHNTPTQQSIIKDNMTTNNNGPAIPQNKTFMGQYNNTIDENGELKQHPTRAVANNIVHV